MKVQNYNIFLISFILLISQVYTLAMTNQEEVHEDTPTNVEPEENNN